MPQTPPARTHASLLARCLPGLLVILVFVALIAPALSPEVQLFYRDTGRLYYPVKKFIADELRRGHLPLWDPRTESGTSILGQTTPGLLHPLTLLYLVFPFDLAFKLNHLLGLPLAALGAFLLARRLGASAWGAAAAAVTYGGCGYLVSMASSNLPYVVGPSAVPFAIDGLLAFSAAPSPLRLLWAAFALALPALAGEPQSMLLAGVIGSALVVARALFGGPPSPSGQRVRKALRCGLLAGLWGIAALALSAPASFPSAARLQLSTRGHGVSAYERSIFLVVPARLWGYLVPKAFDDPGEVFDSTQPEVSANQFPEFFSPEMKGAFSDSILIGAPALLLALLGCASGRKGRFLFAGGVLFALTSTGAALGVQEALMAVVPGFRYFRYAEKFAGPATLLFSLAAALGLDDCLAGGRRPARRLAVVALAFSLAGAAFALCIVPLRPRLMEALVAAGNLHQRAPAARFLFSLRSGLWLMAALSLALAVVALLRARTSSRSAAALGALVCAASVVAANTDALLVGPVELLHGPFALADYLLMRGGPSEGRWRLFTNSESQSVPMNRALGERVGGQEGLSQSLIPQFENLAGIEGASSYFTAPDKRYGNAFEAAPYQMGLLLGVRFFLAQPYDSTPAGARQHGFERLPRGYWLRELPPRPRAFLVDAVRAVPDAEMDRALADPAFSSTTEALISDRDASLVRDLPVLTGGPSSLPAPGEAGARTDRGAPAGSAAWARPVPDEIDVQVAAQRRALLVVSEHFDPGWKAMVDGVATSHLRVDDAAIGVPVAQGPHRVRLVFRPQGLVAGLWTCGAALALIGLWSLIRRQILSGGDRNRHPGGAPDPAMT